MKRLFFFLIFLSLFFNACRQSSGNKSLDLAIEIQKLRMDSMHLAFKIAEPTNYGFKFKEAEITPCDEDMSEYLESKIRGVKKTDSTLLVDIYLGTMN